LYKRHILAGGDYVICWPDAARERALIWPKKAHEMAVAYDPEITGRVVRAAKLWRGEDKHMRLNLYYPDRIEKYRSRKESRDPLSSGFKPADLEPLSYSLGQDGDMAIEDVVSNPYGVVPVFHFPNKRTVVLRITAPSRPQPVAGQPAEGAPDACAGAKAIALLIDPHAATDEEACLEGR